MCSQPSGDKCWSRFSSEDNPYFSHGDAWTYFSHDQARSRAYDCGEDALAGFSDVGFITDECLVKKIFTSSP
jgi:hypothetical protein